MRYSFHGKVRATGQQVDGFVEANSSTEAIDRLADQGIIGVYTVRPEAKLPRNPVVLSGEDSYEDEHPAPAQLPAPVAPPVPVAAAPVSNPTDSAILALLVDKVSTLLVQVDKLLSRPAQVIYQSGGPARGDGGGGGKKKASRNVSDAQNSTLRDIFQNNLDLRRGLDKLASAVGQVPAAAEAPEIESPRVESPRVESPVVASSPVLDGDAHGGGHGPSADHGSGGGGVNGDSLNGSGPLPTIDAVVINSSTQDATDDASVGNAAADTDRAGDNAKDNAHSFESSYETVSDDLHESNGRANGRSRQQAQPAA